MLSLIVEPWDLGKWSGVPPERIAVFAASLFICGLLAAGLIQWEHRKERRRWAVCVSDELVSIVDDKGRKTDIPVAALELIVATSSQSIWRGDLSIALFDESNEPLILFPLIASGGDNFIQWLSERKGFRSTEFADAKATGRSTGQVIWEAD
jgi:hypothetical protein